MDTTRTLGGERTELTESILELYAAFCAGMVINARERWLSVDLTVQQIKVLLIASGARVTTGEIARRLSIALPSATRLVDRLVEHGLVTREENPTDRRYTNVLPTPAGQEIVDSLNAYRRVYLGAALASLNLEALHQVRQGFVHLAAACTPGETEAAATPKEPIRG